MVKYEDKSNVIMLDNKDFKFIDYYMKKYKIEVGKGKAIELSIILNEYKLYNIDK